MSLFVCDACGCVDNTALTRYWLRGDGRALCSACDPAVGRWHGRFPRERYDGKREVRNRPLER